MAHANRVLVDQIARSSTMCEVCSVTDLCSRKELMKKREHVLEQWLTGKLNKSDTVCVFTVMRTNVCIRQLMLSRKLVVWH